MISLNSKKADSATNILWQSGTGISLKAFSGSEAEIYFKQIASLRMDLYKEFPYLYEGTFTCEKAYLSTYFHSEDSNILLVFDHERLVGFSNSIPLDQESDWLVKPFERFGLDPKEYLYLSEFTIKAPYRKMGLLRRFVEYHEMKAQLNGLSKSVFMTVQRPLSHPLRPDNYRPLELIWQHFGYNLVPGLDIVFLWDQIDSKKEETNRLDIWQKSL